VTKSFARLSETDLQRAIKEALEGMGVWVMRMGVNVKRSRFGTISGEPGCPDLWTEYGWLEVKLPGEVLSPDQVDWHKKAKRHGLNVETVYSVGQAVDEIQHWRRAVLSHIPRRWNR
jgi:hypothetical protein